MTTIAANRETMAADTRVSWSDPGNDRINTTSSIKIERIGDSLVGTSGDFQAGVRFHDWYRAGSKGRKPRLAKEFRALRLSPDGLYIIDGDDTTWVKVDYKLAAIGSGAHYAMGAMEMGAPPEEAVRIAMKHDVYTGGSITVVHLKEPHEDVVA